MTVRPSLPEQRGDALRQLKERGLQAATVPKAAVLMGIHPHTLRRYIEIGKVKTMLIGKRHWVPLEVIELYNREAN